MNNRLRVDVRMRMVRRTLFVKYIRPLFIFLFVALSITQVGNLYLNCVIGIVFVVLMSTAVYAYTSDAIELGDDYAGIRGDEQRRIELRAFYALLVTLCFIFVFETIKVILNSSHIIPSAHAEIGSRIGLFQSLIVAILALAAAIMTFWRVCYLSNHLVQSSGTRLSRKVNDIRSVLRLEDALLHKALIEVQLVIDTGDIRHWPAAEAALRNILSHREIVRLLEHDHKRDDDQPADAEYPNRSGAGEIGYDEHELLWKPIRSIKEKEDIEKYADDLRRALTVILRVKALIDAKPPDDKVYVLSAANAFVEEAQTMLTRRAAWFVVSGIASIAILSCLLYYSVQNAVRNLQHIHAEYKDISASNDKQPFSAIERSAASGSHYQDTDAKVVINKQDNNVKSGMQALIVDLFASLAYSGLIFVGIKGLLSIGRACLHEAAGLYDRRHALRFGKLYIHLYWDRLEFKELQEAFQWNKEARTAFQDIVVKEVADTPTNRLTQSMADLVSKVVEKRLDDAGGSKKTDKDEARGAEALNGVK